MERFNKLAKMGMIKKKGAELAKAIFFSKVIIITGSASHFLISESGRQIVFTTRLYIGFALLGALIYTDACTRFD